MPWRAGGAAVHWRFKSARRDTWPHAPQRVSRAQGDYASSAFDSDALSGVMQEYFPRGRYITKTEFESGECKT